MGASPARAPDDGRRNELADRVGRSLVALACLAIIAWMTYEALGFGTEPRRAPLVVGVPATLMAVALLVREVRGTEPTGAAEESTNLQAPVDPAGSEDAGEDPGEGDVAEEREDQLTTLGAAAWIGVLTAMFLMVGFLVTTLLFPVVFMRLYGKERWRTIAITAVSVFAVTYLFFVIILEIQVYRGMVPVPGLDALL